MFMLVLMQFCFSALLVELEWSYAIDECVSAWLDTGAVTERFIADHPDGVTWDCESVCPAPPPPATLVATTLPDGTISSVPSMSAAATAELAQLCATCGGFPPNFPECLGQPWGQHFPDIPTAMYFMTVTVSTVGYGDLGPQTSAGRFFVVIVILCGILFLAMPLSSVGGSFDRAWDSRLMVKLTRLMRQLAVENNLGNVRNCQRAFEHLASPTDGRIAYDAFAAFVRETLCLRLTNIEMIRLWQQLDLRKVGSIAISEFTELFFPEGAQSQTVASPEQVRGTSEVHAASDEGEPALRADSGHPIRKPNAASESGGPVGASRGCDKAGLSGLSATTSVRSDRDLAAEQLQEMQQLVAEETRRILVEATAKLEAKLEAVSQQVAATQLRPAIGQSRAHSPRGDRRRSLEA